MTANAIIELVLRIVSIVGYVLLAIIAIKRKKTVVQSTEQSEESENAFDKLLGFIVAEIKDCEVKGEQINGKSGIFKFDWVFNHAKEYARELGLDVDKAYLTERIEALVKLLNFNKTTSVQSTEQEIINVEVTL